VGREETINIIRRKSLFIEVIWRRQNYVIGFARAIVIYGDDAGHKDRKKSSALLINLLKSF
jgi:hypothetical protein